MKTKLLLLTAILFLTLSQGNGQIVINLNAANPAESLPTISSSEVFANTVSVAGATGNAYWAFQSPPPGATLSPDGSTLTKDGVTFTLPGGEDEPVPPASLVNIAGGGTQTSFGVTLRVTDDDAISGGQPATTKEVIVTVRENVSVAFVLDRSGSMNSPPVSGGAGVSRWQILEGASSVFLEKLNTYHLAGDQASLTYFASAVDNPPAAFGSALTDVSGNLTSFTGDIGGQSPGGSTAMGEGLLAGKVKLEAGPADRKKVMFLFTDGEQNAGDEVNGAGTASDGGTSLNNGSNSISIYTIGTGAAALTPPATLLENIANANNGQAFIVNETASGNIINEINAQSVNFFDETFINILSGSSPQLVERQKGVGTGTPVTHSAPNQGKEHVFNVNNGVEKVGFQVVALGENVSIRVSKDGTDVTKLGRNSSNPGYYYYNMNFPSRRVPNMKPGGEWKVSVFAGKGQEYNISCIVDDHQLDYDAKGHDGVLYIGKPLKPEATISRLDSAITDAKIVVTVYRPGDDHGHLLATLNADLGGGSTNDPNSVAHSKHLALLAQNPAYAKALAYQPNRIELKHTGGGKYEGSFGDTDVTGIYQLEFDISGTHPILGNFKRSVVRSVVVRPPAFDIEGSGATVTKGPSGTLLSFRPAYTFKGQTRYYGPGYGKYFDVSGNNVSFVGLGEEPDGSVTLEIGGDPNANMELSLLGNTMYTGKVSDFAKFEQEREFFEKLKDWWEGLGLPMWLFWVLLVVILIILGLIARKKKKS